MNHGFSTAALLLAVACAARCAGMAGSGQREFQPPAGQRTDAQFPNA